LINKQTKIEEKVQHLKIQNIAAKKLQGFAKGAGKNRRT
jgi:hypothetical protein